MSRVLPWSWPQPARRRQAPPSSPITRRPTPTSPRSSRSPSSSPCRRAPWAPLPKDIKTTDKLVEFRHPDGLNAKGDVGPAPRRCQALGPFGALGKSGLLQTGDIMLTFRSEWGGAGAYPNIQMGISHTSFGYIDKNGNLRNLDNPMDGEYVGPGNLTSEHYRTAQLPAHHPSAEPDGCAESQPARLGNEAQRQRGEGLPEPDQLQPGLQRAEVQAGLEPRLREAVRTDRARPGPRRQAARHVLLGVRVVAPVAAQLRSGEERWPTSRAAACPACIKEPMEPMKATGNVLPTHGKNSYSGLADGPLLVLDAMELPDDVRKPIIDGIFTENPAGMSKMSIGHRTVAEEMQPRFERLKSYYVGMTGRMWQNWRARLIGTGFNWAGIAENYSPTSYLINTLLPENNINRTMDYVATVFIE
ncbi:MAG: hypothetical protein WDN31_00280 [Hyphomicrobium sp.]